MTNTHFTKFQSDSILDNNSIFIELQVIIIQKYYRRWLAKRYVQKLKMDKQQRLEWEREEEIRKRKDKEDRIKKEFERRMNPKTKEDFDLLYHALEKWRQEELERINQSMDNAERKAALCMLLDQETQLISAIGRHKLEADSENQEKRIQQFLNKVQPSIGKYRMELCCDGYCLFYMFDTSYSIHMKWT